MGWSSRPQRLVNLFFIIKRSTATALCVQAIGFNVHRLLDGFELATSTSGLTSAASSALLVLLCVDVRSTTAVDGIPVVNRMDILIRSSSSLRCKRIPTLTTQRINRGRRSLFTSRAPRDVTSTLRTAIANSTFFSDNVRWQGAMLAAGVSPGPEEREVELESRLDVSKPRETEGPSPPRSSPPSTSLATTSPSIPLEAFKAHPPLTPSRLLRVYSQLSKARLTTLIVLTAMSGVALSPLPATVPVLLSTALGTFLCSASANTWNQISEVPFDAQMVRTRNRPLVRRVISPSHAAAFGAVSGIAGVGILWACVNPLTAALGAFNIWLYAGAYTPLKRLHPVNTWVGAVVGAIPPVMGWTACGGHIIPSAAYPLTVHLPKWIAEATARPPEFLIAADPSVIPLSTVVDSVGDNPLAAMALFALLFSWQFPHFNPLAHLTRDGYARAGYQMLSVTDAQHNAMVSLRHATLLFPICSLLIPLSGLTGWWFALTSIVPNVFALRAALSWCKAVEGEHPSEKQARRLWTTCLWYLPVILGLMMIHKRESWWSEWISGESKEKVAEQVQEE